MPSRATALEPIAYDAPAMATYHLAQCNIARLQSPLDSPQLAEFVAALEPVNQLADHSPGFVWRLQTEDGDATAIRAFDDEMLIVNMSVWESIEALAEFVYQSGHRDVMRRRRQWFEKPADAYMVLWWIPAGTVPSIPDAEVALQRLRREGPTARAFTFRSPFLSPSATGARESVPDKWFCAT
jgi:heme-degrading monooxygenase HmoA